MSELAAKNTGHGTVSLHGTRRPTAPQSKPHLEALPKVEVAARAESQQDDARDQAQQRNHQQLDELHDKRNPTKSASRRARERDGQAKRDRQPAIQPARTPMCCSSDLPEASSTRNETGVGESRVIGATTTPEKNLPTLSPAQPEPCKPVSRVTTVHRTTCIAARSGAHTFFEFGEQRALLFRVLGLLGNQLRRRLNALRLQTVLPTAQQGHNQSISTSARQEKRA